MAYNLIDTQEKHKRDFFFRKMRVLLPLVVQIMASELLGHVSGTLLSQVNHADLIIKDIKMPRVVVWIKMNAINVCIERRQAVLLSALSNQLFIHLYLLKVCEHLLILRAEMTELYGLPSAEDLKRILFLHDQRKRVNLSSFVVNLHNNVNCSHIGNSNIMHCIVARLIFAI